MGHIIILCFGWISTPQRLVSIDHLVLDVTLVTNAPKRTFVSVLPRVYSGRHIDHPSVTAWKARQLRIDAPDSIVYADGERIGPLPATVALRDRALEVLDAHHA